MEELNINDKELIDIIAKESEPLFKEQFINGVIVGWIQNFSLRRLQCFWKWMVMMVSQQYECN